MAIPELSKQNILEALKWIDGNGVPDHKQSKEYDLITEDGKKYPPKYVIEIAAKIAVGADLSVNDFTSGEARALLTNLGCVIESKQEKYELTITADSITSTDDRFTMDNISLGDRYKPLSAVFVKSDGTAVQRSYRKGEKRISNQTLPRLACQIFEKQLVALSVEDKQSFPVCRYSPTSDLICGIYPSVEEWETALKTKSYEHLTYNCSNGRVFIIYSWNIFSTLLFVQECLKRFGDPGDKFILIYREKNEKEENKKDEEMFSDAEAREERIREYKEYGNKYSSILLDSKNIILRGAPGTGKTYLAKQIAADIVSDGYYDSYEQLTDEQKEQIEFVQFHPNYDYSDFVEGLRPVLREDGTMGFELQDGIFTRFISRARKNYENSLKTGEMIAKEASAEEAMEEFFAEVGYGEEIFKTITGNKFWVVNADEKHINIYIPGNSTVKTLSLNTGELKKMLESDVEFTQIKDVTEFFGKQFATQAYSYDFALYQAIKKGKQSATNIKKQSTERKKYIFIIDEINRGEISKIFGELFYAIDPGYRGTAGEISTQYSNMHADPKEKFYIPENVYIIGTMNDIDRSVDSLDFAMRRRFRFIEIKAGDRDRLEMLAVLSDEIRDDAINRMTALNKAIVQVEELNESYQIGASYFLNLKTMNFDQLWTDCLRPLLEEYVRGMFDEAKIMSDLAKAYGYTAPVSGEGNEAEND